MFRYNCMKREFLLDRRGSSHQITTQQKVCCLIYFRNLIISLCSAQTCSYSKCWWSFKFWSKRIQFRERNWAELLVSVNNPPPVLVLLQVALPDESLWNRSLNVRPREKEKRNRQLLMYFFSTFCLVLFVLRSRPVWVDKCAWCLFFFFSWRDKKTSGCSAFVISSRLNSRKRWFFFFFLLPIMNLWDHDASWSRAGGRSGQSSARCLCLVSCVGHVPAVSRCRQTTHKHRRRITFQTLMNVENKSLLTWSSVNHVRNQKMLYLYNQLCNKDGELVLEAFKGQFTQKWTLSHHLLTLMPMEGQVNFQNSLK